MLTFLICKIILRNRYSGSKIFQILNITSVYLIPIRINLRHAPRATKIYQMLAVGWGGIFAPHMVDNLPLFPVWDLWEMWEPGKMWEMWDAGMGLNG